MVMKTINKLEKYLAVDHSNSYPYFFYRRADENQRFL